jgi:hypothetical protein
MSKMYHKDVFFPTFLLGDLNIYRPMSVIPTRHALESATARGFRAPRTIPVGAVVIEVEVGSHGSVDKLVYRFGWSHTHDMVAVVRGDRLITCWLNERNDKHSTLDRNKYARA